MVQRQQKNMEQQIGDVQIFPSFLFPFMLFSASRNCILSMRVFMIPFALIERSVSNNPLSFPFTTSSALLIISEFISLCAEAAV